MFLTTRPQNTWSKTDRMEEKLKKNIKEIIVEVAFSNLKNQKRTLWITAAWEIPPHATLQPYYFQISSSLCIVISWHLRKLVSSANLFILIFPSPKSPFSPFSPKDKNGFRISPIIVHLLIQGRQHTKLKENNLNFKTVLHLGSITYNQITSSK